MFIDTNPVPVKVAAAEMGIISSPEVRLPMAPINEGSRKILMACLKDYGLLK
jgi:4-hydroxy-tetrahydrodipicolinate synthase